MKSVVGAGAVILITLIVIVMVGALDRPSPESEQPLQAGREAAATATPDTADSANAVEVGSESAAPISSPQSQYPVVAVIDGDTIDVEIDGEVKRVRYIGINTPETVHPTRDVECFGEEASARNKTLVLDMKVGLEKDVSETDKYGRLLRYVYVGGVMVNETLVREGYASVSTYPPDVRHTERFLIAETAARTEGRGLWGAGCEPYASGAKDVGEVEAEGSASACLIKGNIAIESGEHIYHLPGCEYYEATRINEEKGERWFCSEEEALAAGWRRALNCPAYP